MSMGIDVSDNNGRLDISNGTLSHQFIIAKASEGATEQDPDYGFYGEQAEELGAQFGAYHFFHAERLEARAEAVNFVSAARPRSMLSLWLDYETYGVSGQHDAQQIGYFISYVKVLIPAAKVGIYANGVGYGRIAPYLAEIPFNGFWFAAPSVPVEEQTLPLKWQIHQYGEANGVDLDYSTWTPAQMAAYWKFPS